MNFLEYIKKYEYGHIPSALSQIYYLNHIFCNELVKPYEHNIVLGKPFGSAAYYYIWDRMGYIEDKKYNAGVKEYEIDFVDFSEETLGNALGIASGMELGNGKMTYVNLSDSQLQMGPTLEAIQFIGRHQQNITVTIDYNREQLTSGLLTDTASDIMFFENNGWEVFSIDNTYDWFEFGFEYSCPVVFFVNTKKGDGIVEMEEDIKYWHYRPIDNEILTMTDKLRNL